MVELSVTIMEKLLCSGRNIETLGCSAQVQMHFNLQELIQQHDLQQIESPFTKEDIDRVVKRLPVDKAPGPDGFNGLFLKKCWHIIKEDIY
jgi:hypothetical protein